MSSSSGCGCSWGCSRGREAVLGIVTAEPADMEPVQGCCSFIEWQPQKKALRAAGCAVQAGGA